MTENGQTKVCPFCAETINAASKKCPRCRSGLASGKDKVRACIRMGALYAFFIGPFLLASWWMRDIKSPGLAFEPFRSKLVVFDTLMHFTPSSVTNVVSTVGYLRNDSPHTWKDMQLEVQYFDAAGKLVDTKTETLKYQEIPAGITEAFRIRSAAASEESAYASHKVFVRAAKDARKSWVNAD